MDLNLVRVFVAIFETGSLTLASERLFVTQSAVSQSLSRLRAQFNDPLFERAAREMRPTPLAESMFPGFRDALARIDRTMDDANHFDPSTSERTFRIALSELGEIGWLPLLYRAISRRAPRVHLAVMPLETDELADSLRRGEIDLAVSPTDLGAEFVHTRVKTQGYCVLTSVDSPLPRDTMTREQYETAAHAVVTSDTSLTLIRNAQVRAGLEIRPRVTVQHFATLPQLLTENPELIATIPVSIAQGWELTWPLRLLTLPFEMPPIELSLYQRTTSQNAGSLDWFARTVAPVLEASPGEFAALSVIDPGSRER